MDNLFVIALANTLMVPLAVIVLGLLVNVINQLILGILSDILGGTVASFVRNRLTFLGTIHHELSHALLGVLTGAKITKIELIKLRGDALGSVHFYPRGNAILRNVQITMIAIAPVLCGCMTLFGLNRLLVNHCDQIWQYIVVIALQITILFHMTLSPKDIKNALHGLPVCMLLLYVIFLVLYFFTGFRII